MGALLLHGAAAVAVLWTPAPPGAQLPGIGGVEISLGPAGGSPGDAATDAPPPTEVEPVETIEAVDAMEPETAEVVPQEVPVETPPEPVVAEAVPIEPPKPPEPVEVKPKEPMPIPPKVVRPPKPQPPEPRETVEPAPTPARTTPAVAGTQGKSGTKDSKDAGSGDDSQGGGMAGATADYVSVLQAWLEKHKEYPRSARLRRIQGVVLLSFAIDRAGQVLAFRVERSSGHRSLDRETLAMIRRANPLPPIPNDMERDKLEIVVPVQFSLR